MPPRFVYDLPVSDIILLYSKSRNCFYVDPTESINIPTVIRYPGLTKHPNLCRLIYESIFFSKSIERCKYCAYIHTVIFNSPCIHRLLTIIFSQSFHLLCTALHLISSSTSTRVRTLCVPTKETWHETRDDAPFFFSQQRKISLRHRYKQWIDQSKISRRLELAG